MNTLLPPRVRPVTAPARGRHVALVVAAGIGFDIGLRAGIVAIGGSIAVALAATALLASGRIRSGLGRACMTVAIVFGTFLALRTSDWLVAIDLLVIAGSLVVGALLGSDVLADDVRPGVLTGRALAGALPMATGAAYVSAPLRRWIAPGERSRRQHLAGVGRGLALAVPVIVVLGGLLASADAVFADSPGSTGCSRPIRGATSCWS